MPGHVPSTAAVEELAACVDTTTKLEDAAESDTAGPTSRQARDYGVACMILELIRAPRRAYSGLKNVPFPNTM